MPFLKHPNANLEHPQEVATDFVRAPNQLSEKSTLTRVIVQGETAPGTTGCVQATSTSPARYGFGCIFVEVILART